MSQLEIYSDGGASPNPGKGAWGVVLVQDGAILKEFSGGEQLSSNNRMELMAAIRGLCAIDENQAVVFHTDSNYVRQGITDWIKKWKANGWRTANKKPVKNQDLWEWLDDLASRRTIEWKWVKGHSGDKWNEHVDLLVNRTREFLE